MIGQELLEKSLLFATPFTVSSEAQREIIAGALREGAELPPEDGIRPFWIGLGLTSPTRWPAGIPDSERGWWPYFARLDENIDWKWNETGVTPLVRKVLAPIEPFFRRFTRVTVVLQKPGSHLPAHRDLVPGDTYSRMADSYLTVRGKHRLRYRGRHWFAENGEPMPEDRHRSQMYLNLKVPLSLDPNSAGAPFIVRDGKKLRYDSRGRMFFLNEVEIEHGADAVDFYRGVIFVDGFFDFSAWPDLRKEPVAVRELGLMDYNEEVELCTEAGLVFDT